MVSHNAIYMLRLLGYWLILKSLIAEQTTSGTSDGASSSSKESIQPGKKLSISEPTPDPGI